MAQFNYENFTSNMPDAFQKDKQGNIHKLLSIEKHIYDRIHTMFQSVYEVLDINNAKGKVLDMYGERLNLKRGAYPDEQYLILLKTKIAQNLSDGTRDSIAKALAFVLSTTTDKIRIKSDDKTGSVQILDVPLMVLTEAGFLDEQITELVESLLPQGVTVSGANFTGTFEFGTVDENGTMEYDETKGFADIEGTIGGYLGLFS